MNEYPPESQNLDVIGHLEELRRRILTSLACLTLAVVIAFSQGRSLIALAKLPLKGLVDNLIFITPTEVFASFIKVSFLAGVIACFPILLYQLWAFVSPAASAPAKKNIVRWMVLAIGCFAAGILFSYLIALPAALKFLLTFGEGVAIPQITLTKYISFFSAIVFLGGCIFEIPIIIGLLTDMGFLKSRTLKGKRQYAVLIIFIIAAVITPTHDMVNMLVFAVPMILLFEAGIILSGFIERIKKKG